MVGVPINLPGSVTAHIFKLVAYKVNAPGTKHSCQQVPVKP
ncbi:hypothetical protein M3J09_008154 [Ascochyta lentis]